MSNFVLTPNAVAKLRRAIAPRSGNTGAVAASGRPINPDNFPPPFTVRWSASANDGAGAWLIWLPDVAQLVMLKAEYITPTGVTAEQALPAGWYTIDDATASSTEVYLNITIPETGTASAEISTTQGQSMTGEAVMGILVAEMETDPQTGAKRVKQHVDSAALVGSVKDGESGADAGIYITQEPIAPSTDYPGGGIQITFQPLQDGQPHGQPTVVTLWNGSGGGGGGTDLSDTPALDVVPSTGQASAGVDVTASRQDHVHKMPATVVLTNNTQTITGRKTFARRVTIDESASGGGISDYHGRAIYIQDIAQGIPWIALYGARGDSRYNFDSLDLHAQMILSKVYEYLRISAFHGYQIQLYADANKSIVYNEPNVAPSAIDNNTRKAIATLGWVLAHFQQKLTAGNNVTIVGNVISATQPTVNDGTLTIKQGTTTLGTFTANQSTGTTVTIPEPVSGSVTFLEDVTWDATNHTLVKTWGTLDLATGAVTHNSGTPSGKTATIATTGISTILARQNGNGNA